MTRGKSTNTGKVWQASDAVHIDVRGLDAPEPMIAILRMLDGGEVDNVLIAHLDREPVFLYPELDQRGWTHEIISYTRERGEEEVQLRLVRLSV